MSKDAVEKTNNKDVVSRFPKRCYDRESGRPSNDNIHE